MLPQTEMLRDEVEGLDLRPDVDILGYLLEAQKAALRGLDGCLDALSEGAAILTDTVHRGGRIYYAAAGSSGMMGLADGAELSGTFGLSPESMAICMAGGIPQGAAMPGHTEDDETAAQTAAANVQQGDAVIAISASGSTPYAVEFARHARVQGAKVIGIANNAEASLFDYVDCAVHLNTPPEPIAGSTRLGAATAQKVALNMMSTLMGIRLGHVHDGMMINVIADNHKLRQRAEGIVGKIAGVSAEQASAALTQASGNVKQAILLAAGADSPDRAEALLAQSDGHLRPALKQL
jgi:N-acetylmuramic acid 6-phosphate etherase